MLRTLFNTESTTAPLIARVVLGAVILPHGLQKTVGLFGGYGFDGTMGFFTQTMGIPWIFAFAAILAESLGAIALITGALGRVAAASIAAIMVVAIATTHWQHGFFMNWFGQQGGEGFEFHLLALGLAAIVVVRGSGLWSVDQLVSRFLAKPRENTAVNGKTLAA